jgi:hypothetical protein
MEYRVKSFSYPGECETWLNQMSDNGWDLYDFTVTSHGNGGRDITVVMEREKTNE